MRDKPLVTVYIVTYNRAYYLKECIESVLNQTYKNFDLYILDNASTDNTKKVVGMFDDERVKYIRHTENIGGIANINYAIQLCETKYLIVFHDDDIMEPDLIAVELKEMEQHAQYAIISSEVICINGDNEEIKSKNKMIKGNHKKKCYCNNEYLQSFLNGQGRVNCPSVMFRNSFLKSNKLLFQADVGPAADQYLWFEIENAGGVICCLNQTLMKYRRHEKQDSHLNSLTMLVDLYKTLNNHDGYKNILFKHRAITEKKFLRIAIKMGLKYTNQEFSLTKFLISMNVIMKELCYKKHIVLIVKMVGFMAIKSPKIYYWTFNILKKVLGGKRRVFFSL